MRRQEISKLAKKCSTTSTQRILGKFWDSVETIALVIVLVVVMSFLVGYLLQYISN